MVRGGVGPRGVLVSAREAPGRPEALRVLASVANDVRADMPALVRRATDLIAAREADYRGRGALAPDDLRLSLDANFEGILTALADGRAAADGELSVPRSTGRRRAEQGIALESVLRAYRLGGQVLLGALMRCARARPAEDLAAFLSVAMVALDMVDRYSEAVVLGYRQAEAERQRRDSQRQQAAFDALLDGRATESAASAARALGLPHQGPYLVVVCAFDPAADFAPASLRDVCAAFGLPSAWRTRSHHEIGIVAPGPVSVPGFLDAVRGAVAARIGVSGLLHSLRDTPDAHRLARAALLTIPADARDVAWIDERLVECLVASSPDLARMLAARALGPVLRLDEPDRGLLLETLSAWYGCDRSATAAGLRLACHRNTVLNRLRRIETLARLSLDDHHGLLMCHLALLSLRLVPQPS
jgi:hypothetical protein